MHRYEFAVSGSIVRDDDNTFRLGITTGFSGRLDTKMIKLLAHNVHAHQRANRYIYKALIACLEASSPHFSLDTFPRKKKPMNFDVTAELLKGAAKMEDRARRKCSREKSPGAIAVVGSREIKRRHRGMGYDERQRRARGKKGRAVHAYFTRAHAQSPSIFVEAH